MSASVIKRLTLKVPIIQKGDEPIKELVFHEVTMGDISDFKLSFDSGSVMAAAKSSTGLPEMVMNGLSPKDYPAVAEVVAEIFGLGPETTDVSPQPSQ